MITENNYEQLCEQRRSCAIAQAIAKWEVRIAELQLDRLEASAFISAEGSSEGRKKEQAVIDLEAEPRYAQALIDIKEAQVKSASLGVDIDEVEECIGYVLEMAVDGEDETIYG